MKDLFKFIRATLSTGTDSSFSRTASATIILFLVTWTTYIVAKTAAIPDIPVQWAATIAMLYGFGKWGETVQNGQKP